MLDIMLEKIVCPVFEVLFKPFFVSLYLNLRFVNDASFRKIGSKRESFQEEILFLSSSRENAFKNALKIRKTIYTNKMTQTQKNQIRRIQSISFSRVIIFSRINLNCNIK